MSIDNKIFVNIADNNFGMYSRCSEEDVDYLTSIFRNKTKVRDAMKNMLGYPNDMPLTLKQTTRVELFCLLTEFLFENYDGISPIEISTIYSIFDSTMTLSFKKNLKNEIFDHFKNV